ncbi:hypothetical protein PC116_g9902 [Phytophthora cactorum]|uniref:Uncharacterized protein n=1 Tax=Phytophthora cactorum TaxID=29920 RepID=A0A329SUK0_9STRA|nr:hypothetical protein PC112_g7014 [Phytophthora cactorum]KAG2861504.1 hypothetical protein PC113_g7139 [Phytophthora cactorum]KAG2918871.1 hypothetical protein PC114_g6646 [Phytophthora cactorum]KAG2931571.1 hypothetical protein PC115_g6072 [Phytophthora cactorum]KAG2947122.1 hypothetical protein PC117_g7077 [Phytophthora cactorum]
MGGALYEALIGSGRFALPGHAGAVALRLSHLY